MRLDIALSEVFLFNLRHSGSLSLGNRRLTQGTDLFSCCIVLNYPEIIPIPGMSIILMHPLTISCQHEEAAVQAAVQIYSTY